MNSVLNDLVEIAQIERARLKELTERMDSSSPRELEGLARNIDECATNLSSCLARLAKHIDALPGTEPSRDEKPSDPRLMELTRAFMALTSESVCDACGGAVFAEPDVTPEMPWRSVNRARRADTTE